MKGFKIILSLFLISISSLLYGQERERFPEGEIKEIIELAIELPELQQYFHVDTDTTRVPLVIKEFGTVNSKNLEGIFKFGEQVQVLDGLTIKKKDIKAYLTIGDWTYGGNNLRLQMEYPIEGILINIRMNRINGRWEIVDSIIFEN